MRFAQPLIEGRLLRRYKRFLADVELAGGEVITAHTANTGAMTGCAEPGSHVWLSLSDNPKRKYPHTWELVEARPGVLAGINTQRSNALVAEAIAAGRVPALSGYSRLCHEVRYGEENSRIDLLLEFDAAPPCYVEVKNVTLVGAGAEAGVASFPDAVSRRARKHLRELEGVVAAGRRGAIFFCVQRGDVRVVRAAEQIDPDYAAALRHAVAAGVEAYALAGEVTPQGIVLNRPLPVSL